MANLFNLLRKKRFDQYNQAMQSSPYIPPYIASQVTASKQEEEAKRAQMLLANEGTGLGGLTADQLGGGAFGAWQNESDWTYDRKSNQYRYSPLGARYESVARFEGDESGWPRQVVEAPMTGTDTIYKDRKDEKGLDFEAMLAALEKHESAGPAGFKSLGKPGGAGKAGGFNLFSPSMVEGRTPPRPIDPDEQRKRWWEAYARSIA